MAIREVPAVDTAHGYQGYFRRDVPYEDSELTRVGPGTPMVEYWLAARVYV